jgi:hypothetical protein
MLEALERRDVPSSLSGIRVLTDIEPNDVITQPQQVGTLDPGQAVQVHGTIGNTAYAGADVDWFAFNVTQGETVTLTLNGSGVVSAYDNDPAVMPLGHALILQFTASGPATAHAINLLPGAYEVAVGGTGNRYFSPVLAGSGTDAAEGPYTLTVAGAKADFDPTASMALVRTDIPAGGYVGSPLALNVFLTGSIDLTQDYITILDACQDDLGPNVTWNSATSDLVFAPAAPLAGGQYQIVGYDSSGNQFLAIPFTVHATPTTDTLATARPLGDLTNSGLVQLPGVIGNDPYYSPFNTAASATNPASQVNMYSFVITGPGQHVLTAEAFAGRIGSPLNPALTLLHITGRDPDGSLAWQVVSGNDNTYNADLASDGERPLYSDSALFADLTAGRYVLAVSATGNYADPVFGTQLGVGGLFDPDQAHSGSQGETTGNYVLSVFVQPAPTTPPTVTQASLQPGAVLDGPPTHITVQFSAPMDLVQLAVASGQQWGMATSGGYVAPALLERFPCYLVDATGNRYFLALDSYYSDTSTATFTALERLSDGQYFLCLSGPNGLTDLAGNPLVGISLSGDYVVPFTVTNSPPRGWSLTLTNPSDSVSAPTDLGVLFPDELAAAVTVTRNFQGATPAPTDEADYYRFTLLEDTTVALSLCGPDLTVAGRPVLLDTNDHPLYPAVDSHHPTSHEVTLLLHAGTYTVMVGSWPPSGAAQAVYTLRFASVSVPENPTPLTSGPAPAYRLRLDTLAPPVDSTSLPGPSGTIPQITLPSQGTPAVSLTVDRSAGSAPSNGDALAGLLSGLAAGPVGIVGSPSATGNDAVRLVLPGTEFPIVTNVAIDAPPIRASASSSGMMLGAVDATLRAVLIYTLDWLRVPPLTPLTLPQEDDAAPEPEPNQTNELPAQAAEVSRVDAAAGVAALALVGGAVVDRDERKASHQM